MRFLFLTPKWTKAKSHLPEDQKYSPILHLENKNINVGNTLKLKFYNFLRFPLLINHIQEYNVMSPALQACYSATTFERRHFEITVKKWDLWIQKGNKERQRILNSGFLLFFFLLLGMSLNIYFLRYGETLQKAGNPSYILSCNLGQVLFSKHPQNCIWQAIFHNGIFTSKLPIL